MLAGFSGLGRIHAVDLRSGIARRYRGGARKTRKFGITCAGIGLRLAAGNVWTANHCNYVLIRPLPSSTPCIRRKRDMKKQQNNLRGFTLVEIMIVVAIIGLLAAIVIPNFVRARTTSQQNACINNLRQIDGAKQQWALENTVPATARPTGAQIQPYLGRGSDGGLPICPADSQQSFATSYSVHSLNRPPTCRISPTNHILQ
jgi:prepilin-type N-terminal cleavage/methylation domain-containing protein